MEKPGDLGLVGIADDEGNAGEGSDFFGRTLRITTGNEDARGRVGGVDFANRVTCLSVGGGSDRAGVENYYVGRGSGGGGRELRVR